MADLVPVKDLVRDEALYPREEVNWANVGRLRDVLKMGGELPPVIVWRETSQVIDGFHRIQAAIAAEGSSHVSVAVEWRDYDSEREAFEDAVRLNAAHGLRLGSADYSLIRDRAERLGMTADQVSRVLKVPMSAFKKQTARVEKGGGRTEYSPPDPSAGVVRPRLSVEHNMALGDVVRDLEPRLQEGREEGPGNLPERMSAVQAARKENDASALRNALLDTAALFIWWAARLELKKQAA